MSGRTHAALFPPALAEQRTCRQGAPCHHRLSVAVSFVTVKRKWLTQEGSFRDDREDCGGGC